MPLLSPARPRLVRLLFLDHVGVREKQGEHGCGGEEYTFNLS